MTEERTAISLERQCTLAVRPLHIEWGPAEWSAYVERGGNARDLYAEVVPYGWQGHGRADGLWRWSVHVRSEWHRVDGVTEQLWPEYASDLCSNVDRAICEAFIAMCERAAS